MGKSRYIGCKNHHGSTIKRSFSKRNISGKSVQHFEVLCACGNTFKVIGQHFKSGATVSCGCIRAAQNLNLTGQIINEIEVLTMLPPVPSDTRKRSRAKVKCFCGNKFICTATELKRKRVYSCGCLSKRSMSARRAKNSGISVEEKAWNWYMKQYINSAKNRKYDFKISKKEFKLICSEMCYYCGSAPSPKNRYRNDRLVTQETIDNSTIYVNGIDRLDSDRGYVAGNCVPCCTECNYHKGKYSLKQFREWINSIVKHGKLI